MSTQRIATSTLWQLSSQVITMLLSIISIKLVTRALSQELVGSYNTVYGYLQIFGIIADFGLYAIAVREISRAENKGLTFGSIFALRAFVTVLSLLVAITVAWVLPSFQGTLLPLGVSIAVFVPFFTLLAGMFRTLFQVHYRMHYVFAAEITGKVIPVLLMIGAVLMGYHSSESSRLYGYMLAFGGIGSFALLTLSLLFARSFPEVLSGLSVSKNELLRLLRLALPFGVIFFLTTIYRQSDLTLIALLRPEDFDIQNAYYGVVLRMAEMGFLLPTFILNSTLPMLSDDSVDPSSHARILGSVLLGLLVLGAVTSLTAFFWAKPLVLLLTRTEYLSTPLSPGSDTALQLVAFSIFLSMLVTFAFYLLLHKHAWRILLGSVFCAAVLSLCLNLSLIPLFGFIGAAMTSIIVHLILSAVLLIFALRRVPVILRFDQFVRFGIFAIVYGWLVSLVSQGLANSLHTLIAGFTAIVVAGVLLKLLGLLPRVLTK